MINSYFKIILFAGFILIISACSSTKRFSNDDNSVYRNSGKVEIGEASFYADEFNGKKTSSGEIYNMNDLTAAHPTFPFNTIVRVTNLANNKSVKVRINDRMPDFKGRLIDLSYAAAKNIGMLNSGVQKVKIEVIQWGDN